MRKSTLLACAMMSAALAPAAELEFSYNANGTEPYWYGTNKKENYDIAVRIENPGLAGSRITRISVPLPGDPDLYGSASAFLTTELVLERVDGVRVNVPDICSVNATIADGMLTATFDEPYTLTTDPIYVGYSFEIAELQEVNKYPIAVVTGTNPEAFWFHSSRTQIKWASYVDKADAGLQSALVVTLEGNFDASTAGISLPERTVLLSNQENQYSFDVINAGVNAISNVGFSWTMGELSGEGEYEFDPPVRNAIGASGTASFTIPAVAENGKESISVTLDKVNGTANPNLSASAKARVVFTPSIPVNRPMVEEYTGLWCGNCPRGYVALEYLKEHYGADFVAAAWHNSDPMAVSSAYPNSVPGYPFAYVNRKIALDPSELYATWPAMYAEPADMSIECSVEFTDDTHSALKATATVTPIDDDDTLYYIGYMLVADGLSDPTWIQSNYYYSPQMAATLPEPYDKMFLEAGPSAAGLTYNDVMVNREYALGVDGSLPREGLKAFTPTSHSVTFDISNIRTTFIRPTAADPDANLIPVNKDKLRVIAYVVRTDGSVVNSCSSLYADGTGVDAVEGINADVEVAHTLWHDLQGHAVSTPAKGQIYVCTQIMSDGSVRSSKVMVK